MNLPILPIKSPAWAILGYIVGIFSLSAWATWMTKQRVRNALQEHREDVARKYLSKKPDGKGP